MAFHIEKKLRVAYSAPVHDCIRRLRVLPLTTLYESWHAWPQPDEVQELCDEFGSRVLQLCHTKIESDFLFELTCIAEQQDSLTVSTPGLPATGIGAFLLPSALCDLSEVIRATATTFNRNSRHDDQLAWQICQWTHQALRYDARASDVETTASHTLKHGAGVCQDYTHLMIALCRACALPARYVSGYLIGEGRMHAWVEVLIMNQWRAYDPTHNRTAGAECLPVASGRDFRDCNPHGGTFRGRAKARLESGCRVRQVTIS